MTKIKEIALSALISFVFLHNLSVNVTRTSLQSLLSYDY